MVQKKQHILSFIALLLILLLAGCSSNTSGNSKIDLSSIEDSRKSVHESKIPPLRVAISSITSTKESIKYYSELLNYLGEKFNRPIVIVQRKTYAEVNNLMRAGNVDLAFVCTYSYIIGRDEFGMELLVAPKMVGSAKYQSYIIVSKESGINSFGDLAGKTFAFTDPLSTTGKMYPVYLLRKMMESPDSFFNKYIYTYSHDNAIKAVSDQLVDGAAVDSLIYYYMAANDPQYTGKLKVIAQSQPYGVPPVVVRPDLEPETKQRLEEFFLGLDRDPMGKKILNKLKIESFFVPSDKEYDSIRLLVKSAMVK
ncbi:MAG: phosphate/phosphite/phosphonate ABC transporter substrate-binding protein [Clostridia bacterium]|nr:phosphate/phosphite/phosphonate ABC transporter substrate-binding protein [Clostridia bacterium]